MAIPFFSIDFRRSDLSAYLGGLFGWRSRRSSQKKLHELISGEFPEKEVLLFPSARMAFYLTLENLFSEGDEIIFPVLGFPLYVKIAVQLGLRPVFVDVESDHLNIDPSLIENKITEKTKGIVVTHLFGHPCRMDEVRNIADRHGLALIEDCAQSYDSNYKGKQTGTFGKAGIFSCSLMKVPTTLGGGILVTGDEVLAASIRERLETPEFRGGLGKRLSYLIKNTISVLNSFSLPYSLFSHHIFGLIKRRNPAMLRRILYSGMGLSGPEFDVWERPRLSGYQVAVGEVQFDRTRPMTEVRRNYAKMIDQALADLPSVTLLKEDESVYWNYQYYVIAVQNMEDVYERMFKRGYHLMQENVWDCTVYGFTDDQGDFPVGSGVNPNLIRIPNNSHLSENQMKNLADALRKACTEAAPSAVSREEVHQS